jgi:hypothetical protein
MLMVKGYAVRLVLANGKSLRAGGAMMHDPGGRDWPRCSVLIGSFTRGSEPVSDLGTRQYYGPGYQARKGSANVPDSKAIDSWRLVGEASQIFYKRTGNIYGGQLFRHKFSRPVRIYKQGRWTRLELGTFCSLGPRGFVSP